METLVIRGEIAPRGSGESGLPIHADARAESIAVAACAAQSNREPMLIAAAIH